MRQNYKFYAKKRKNTKQKEWPQQNRAGKIAKGIFNNREQHLLASSNKCEQQYQLTT